MGTVVRIFGAILIIWSTLFLSGCSEAEPSMPGSSSSVPRPDPTTIPPAPSTAIQVRPSPASFRGLGSSAAWWSRHFDSTETHPCKSDLSALTALSWRIASGDTWCTEMRENVPYADGSPKRDSLIRIQLFTAKPLSEQEVLALVEARLPADAEQLDKRPGRTPGWSTPEGTCLSVAYRSQALQQLNRTLLDSGESATDFPDVSVLLYSSPATLEGTTRPYNPNRVVYASIDSDGGHQINLDGGIPC